MPRQDSGGKKAGARMVEPVAGASTTRNAYSVSHSTNRASKGRDELGKDRRGRRRPAWFPLGGDQAKDALAAAIPPSIRIPDPTVLDVAIKHLASGVGSGFQKNKGGPRRLQSGRLLTVSAVRAVRASYAMRSSSSRVTRQRKGRPAR